MSTAVHFSAAAVHGMRFALVSRVPWYCGHSSTGNGYSKPTAVTHACNFYQRSVTLKPQPAEKTPPMLPPVCDDMPAGARLEMLSHLKGAQEPLYLFSLWDRENRGDHKRVNTIKPDTVEAVLY